MHLPVATGRPLAALTLAAASWGLGTVVSKRAVDEIPPITLLSIQLAASVLALSLLLRWRRVAIRHRSVPPALARLGLLNPGVAYALSLLGLAHITASLSVLLWAAEPILILLLAAVLLRERVGPSFLALSGVAIVGMLLVLYQPGTSGSLVGIALTLAGVAACAVYTVTSRRWIVAVDDTASLVVMQQAFALGLAIAVTAALAAAGEPVIATAVSPFGWLTALGSGILYYGGAYWFYLSALRRLPASAAAASFYLIPVFGVAGGVLLLGERLEPLQWVGAATILAAVVLILGRDRSPTERADAQAATG